MFSKFIENTEIGTYAVRERFLQLVYSHQK
jgi:hypothetical protein